MTTACVCFHLSGILEVLHCILVESPEALNIIQRAHIESIISLLYKHGRNHKVNSLNHMITTCMQLDHQILLRFTPISKLLVMHLAFTVFSVLWHQMFTIKRIYCCNKTVPPLCLDSRCSVFPLCL